MTEMDFRVDKLCCSVYKGDELAISATFNYFVGNYSFEIHKFHNNITRTDRPIQLLFVLITPFTFLDGRP